MKKYIQYIIVSFCFSVLMPGVTLAQKKAVQANKIALASHVIDEDGKPIKAATIFGGEGAVRSETDKDGKFQMLVQDAEMLRIEAKGYESTTISAILARDNQIVLAQKPLFLREDDVVQVPFGEVRKRQITGSVSALDAEEISEYDSRQSVFGALNGRVPGLIWNLNVRGYGQALVVIDGIPRADFANLNLEEVEQITVLKDVTARILYGNQADRGVVMVTTKRGKENKRVMNIRAESGIDIPKSYPSYLGAADYMTLYNEALRNDGAPERYSEEQILNTRDGVNPLRYPDADYYSSSFLRDFSMSNRVIAEASGGNENARYYTNLGWDHNSGLVKEGEGENESWNRINLRGNVDYQVTDWLSAKMDAVGIFDMYEGPRYNKGSFWDYASNMHPDYYPLLIPVGSVTDSTIISTARRVKGDYLLGGTSEYQDNVYGDLYQNGSRNRLYRTVQLSTGLNADLEKITAGLSAKAMFSFDLYNEFFEIQNHEYAVYQPSWLSTTGGEDSLVVTPVGQDVRQDKPSISSTSFYRRFGFFGTLDYNRVFNNDHAINASLISYLDQVNEPGQIQNSRNLHYGLRSNYMFQNKYIIDVNAALVGSQRLAKSNRFGFSPSLGLGWILSEEEFLNTSETVNFLKLKGSIGVLKTDRGISDFYLYRTAYSRGGNFNYNNGNNSNQQLDVSTIGNYGLDWTKRLEGNFGFEALLLDKTLWLEGSYYYSKIYDAVTKRSNAYPAYLGGNFPFENYESSSIQGFELGARYQNKIGDWSYSLGGNMVYSVPKELKVDEPIYQDAYRQLEGRVSDARFGYVADGLFEDPDDIESHALQTFGSVQPGDIKYKDLNNDGVIDENDQKLIGNSTPRLYGGIQLNLTYKNFELFAIGTGHFGAETYLNSSYYWVYGERKYSEQVLGRWTQETAQTATYPRLSSQANSNNFRNSTYWLRSNDAFTLDAVQLTYDIPVKTTGFIKQLKLYVKGTSLLTVSKLQEDLELNVGSSPQTRSLSIGLKAAF